MVFGETRSAIFEILISEIHNSWGKKKSKECKMILLVCREKVFIPDTKPYISIIGVENRTSETIITWNDKASDKEKDGSELGTYRSASVAIESDFFCATGITIEVQIIPGNPITIVFSQFRFLISHHLQNSVVAVPGAYGNQAVALRISGNKAMFYRVRILGTQDTLLDDCGSHYFYQCYIQGSIDFIFGSSRSLYQVSSGYVRILNLETESAC